MTRLCEDCGHYYDDEFCWTLCPHGPLWAPVDAYCREHDLVNCKLHDITERVFLYNFDFLRFRKMAEETIRIVNQFRLIGICWKFKFHGGIKLWVDGELIADLITKEHANSYPLRSEELKAQEEICIQVADYQQRNFRWFRPNTACVTLEGFEQEASERCDHVADDESFARGQRCILKKHPDTPLAHIYGGAPIKLEGEMQKFRQ